MNVIRKILVEIESWPNRLSAGLKPMHLEGIDDSVTAEHVHQLVEAGYVQAIQITPPEGPYEMFAPRRLTSAGHDYLDLVRAQGPAFETMHLVAQAPSIASEPRAPIERDRQGAPDLRPQKLEVWAATADADVSQW
jgi:hypothetical protein